MKSPERRRWLGVAALLFAVVFALRFIRQNPADLVTLLYALPIALVAAERGRSWGIAAAALALILFGIWDAADREAAPSTLDYLIGTAAFLLLGGVAGTLADRLRRVSAASDRFWQLSTDLLCTAGFDGYVKRVNPAWERMLGWSEEELRSRPFIEFVHDDDVARTRAESKRLKSDEYRTLVFENRYRCKGGGYRTLLWSARSVVEQERLIYASGRDITESKAAQEELRGSERFLDLVLENLPNMVFVKDAEELRLVRLNRAGEALLGVPREELIGKSDHDLYPEQEADRFVAQDRAALAVGGIVDIPDETIQTVANGSRVLHTRKIAIRDEDGEPRYVLGISEDVTDRRRAERSADAAHAEIERANQSKNQFLSRMSHELRTPLDAVIDFGRLLALDNVNAGQNEADEQIVKPGRHLLELIDEMLDISRIESGRASLSLEPVHLGSVLTDALSLIRPLADEKHVRLICDPAEPGDLHALADQQRLKQVLINLLSNAVKYNRDGGEVGVRCRTLEDGQVEIAVSDTGRGMTAAQVARLFEPFDRLGADGSGIEGTGLGLSLSRGLVQAIGGTIAAESEPGVGTTMRLCLSRAEQPHDVAPWATRAPRRDRRRAEQPREVDDDVAPWTAGAPQPECRTIVHVDAKVSSLKLVDRLLARFPTVRLIPAMKGGLALELVREHQPDLVLLDLQLADLHGRQVLQQLKRDPFTAEIPVVVLSADATPAQFERLLSEGAAGCLTKPIDVEKLLDTVHRSVPSLREG
jgi:PAS domain S-box-containing protein